MRSAIFHFCRFLLFPVNESTSAGSSLYIPFQNHKYIRLLFSLLVGSHGPDVLACPGRHRSCVGKRVERHRCLLSCPYMYADKNNGVDIKCALMNYSWCFIDTRSSLHKKKYLLHVLLSCCQAMRQRGTPPDVFSYNGVMHANVVGGDWATALEVRLLLLVDWCCYFD